ncbi:MAG TPA: tetratricopeptide repeat protein [Anaeromyxobacter sp.]|nr:tetratricopeptide repeat protein [Anaeromyxobacter sp.]
MPALAVPARLLSRPSRAIAFLRGHGRLTVAAAVAAAAVLPYLGSLEDPPILDDGWTALENPLVWSLGHVGRIFRELYGYAGDPSVRGPYRPLTTLSYALNYALHGPWMPGFHAVNLALHALASVLVASLAGRLFGAARPAQRGPVALLAGLLFAVHPAHVEAVVTIYGRTEPLSAVFACGALLLALSAARRPLRLAAATLLLTCAILSKEMAVMVPALFLVVAFALPAAAGLEARPGLSPLPARRALGRALSVAAVLWLAFIPYLVGHGPALAVAPVARWFPVATPKAHLFFTMSRVLGEYLRILVFPSFLGGDFAYAARIPTLTAPTFGFAVATVAWGLTLAAGLALLRPAPLVGIGLTWTFVAILPVLQIVPVGVLLAERLLYLPSVGFCLALAATVAALPSPRRIRGTSRPTRVARLVLWALPATLVALLAARTVVRTRDWRSTVSFWESELEKAPNEVVVNNNLAVAYTSRGEPEKAIARLEVATKNRPSYWRAWVNLGIARGDLGERAAARRAFAEAIRLAPTASDPHRFLARMLEETGDLSGAAAALLQARRNAPEQEALARELGAVLLKAGRREEARAALLDAVRLDPRDGEARRLLLETGPLAPAPPSP